VFYTNATQNVMSPVTGTLQAPDKNYTVFYISAKKENYVMSLVSIG